MLKLICKKCGTKVSILRMCANKCKDCKIRILRRSHTFLNALHFAIVILITLAVGTIFININFYFRWLAPLMIAFFGILTLPLYYKIALWYEKRKPGVVDTNEDEEDHTWSGRRK